MSVPNHSHVPKKLYDTGLYNLKTHDGQGAFVDAVLSTLHGLDANWRHLKKKPSQTQIHGHAEDAALYLFPDGTAQAVDFVAGAGGPNPGPGWIVDTTVYKHSDGHNPEEHGMTSGGAPPAPIKPYPGDPVWDAVGLQLFEDYARANKERPNDPNTLPNPQMGRWFGRTIWDATEGDASGKVYTVEESITKHEAEWCAALGIPVE